MIGRPSLLSAISVAALCIYCSGCARQQAPPPPNADCKSDSSAARVSIYHDVTLSMQGFLLARKEPPYGAFLECVENAAKSAGDLQPKLFQFGKTVEPMSDRDARFSPATYEPRPGYEGNDYAVVVNKAVPDELTVIVTDLFQSNNDVSSVNEAILSRYFSSAPDPKKPAAASNANDRAIGILGIKLPFHGPIFDVGRSHERFAYTGLRPVYAVVLGPQSSVVNYLSGLRAQIANANLGSAASTLVLAPQLAACMPTIDLPAPASDSDINSPLSSSGWLHASKLDRVDDLVTTPRHRLMKQFQIPSGVDESELTLNVPIDSLPYGPELTADEVVVTATPERLKDSGNPPAFEDFPDAAGAFKTTAPVTMRNTGNNHAIMRLHATIDSRRLAKDRIYRFDVVAAADREKFARPSWVKDWNFSASMTPDGAKTLNLSTFLFDLWNGITSHGNPPILRAYFYVKKE